MYTDWKYTKYAGYYHPRTFHHVKRNNTVDINNNFGESRLSASKDKFFFGTNVDISKYDDKEVLIHLAMISQWYSEFYFYLPSEMFYFAVLFLIPALDEKPDIHSAINEVVNDTEVRSQLMLLKNDYEKQTSYRIKNILSFGSKKCRTVCKDEFELYRLIRERTVAGRFKFVYMTPETTFSVTDSHINIPKDILEKVDEHDFENVYSYYPETEYVDLCFKQKITSFDHLKKAKDLAGLEKKTANTKYIKRKFSSRALEISFIELFISAFLSIPVSWMYLRAFEYRSTVYNQYYESIMRHFLFRDIMYYVLLGIIYFSIRYFFSRTVLSPACYFAEDRIVCRSLYEWENSSDSNNRNRILRSNITLTYEMMYTYTYSSIKEYGTFRRMGKKYFYFSKKTLSEEEFNHFRNKIILCDENIVAMYYDEKIYELAKQILPPKKT